MKFNFKYFLVLVTVLLVSSCASTYKPFVVENFPFKELNTENSRIDYTARQGVMFNTSNTRYAKNEIKKDEQYTLVAFKIVNKSDIPVAIKDLNYSCGGSTVITPISMESYLKKVNQKAALHWLWSAAGIVYPKPAYDEVVIGGVKTKVPKEDKGFTKNGKTYIPIPVGLIYGAVNYGIAKKANNKMKKNVADYDLNQKVIQPHDSIFGVLPFKGIPNCGDIYITTPY
ncbi:MAG: hypothetical protein H6553_09135 [Chitinophagales bacterium]|nr:hypothetical protein [Chitinophagales bacterium]